MKRLAVLCIVLLALTSLAFAEVKIEPKVTLAASGTLTWGIDLSTMDTGFNNAADADLTVTFIAADTAETKKGEGAAYGEIKISDIELFFGGDDLTNIPPTDTKDATNLYAWLSDWLVDTDVAAKIVVPPIEIGVYAAPSLYTDALGEIEVDANDDEIVDIETLSTGKTDGIYYAGGAGTATQPFTTTYGTWIKATLGPLAATVKLVSNGDWTGAVPAEYNQYAIGLDGVLTVTPLTVSFGGYEDWVAMETGLYGKVAATVGPIAFWAGIEGNLSTANGFEFVTGGNATLTIATGATLAVTALYGEPINGLDLKVALVEPEAGLIPNADIAVTFYLLDVGDDTLDMEYQSITTVGYKVMMMDTQYVRPFVTFEYGAGNDDVSATADYSNWMYLNAGVQLQLIPLTLFTVQYVSGDLAADGAFVADTGSLQLVAKVTY
jgi:hypothetical protein